MINAISELHGVTTAAELQRQIVKFARALGFDTIGVMAVFDKPSGPSEFHVVDNTPEAYLQAYYDPVLAKVDPVMQHCKRYSETLVWNQETYVSRGYGNLWEHQARFGYRTGIALALHDIGGKHLFVGVDRDKPLTEPSSLVAAMATELREFALHTRDVAFRLFEPKRDIAAAITSLTAPEIECLRWSMDGYSCSQTGERMKISSTTAEQLIRSAMEKLGCTTKYHAVIQALRFGVL